MLTQAGELAKAEGVELSLVQGAVDRIPVPDDSVDHLLMVDVYHELPGHRSTSSSGGTAGASTGGASSRARSARSSRCGRPGRATPEP